MVHALREARRVLKSDGYLCDLRPGPVHRRVGVLRGNSYEEGAVMREAFADDYAANSALSEVINSGLLQMTKRIRFECTRRMDHLTEFEAWLDEFLRLSKAPPHEWLLQRLRQRLQLPSSRLRASELSQTRKSQTRRTRIIVHGPLDLRVLTKRKL